MDSKKTGSRAETPWTAFIGGFCFCLNRDRKQGCGEPPARVIKMDGRIAVVGSDTLLTEDPEDTKGLAHFVEGFLIPYDGGYRWVEVNQVLSKELVDEVTRGGWWPQVHYSQPACKATLDFSRGEEKFRPVLVEVQGTTVLELESEVNQPQLV